MCLSIPSRIVEIDEHNRATVDTMGVRRITSLDLIDEPLAVGDYILLHVGLALQRIDPEEAQASLEIYRQMLAATDADNPDSTA